MGLTPRVCIMGYEVYGLLHWAPAYDKRQKCCLNGYMTGREKSAGSALWTGLREGIPVGVSIFD